MKVVFLDRDGVINTDKGYVHKIEDFEFTEGIFTSLRCLKNKGFHFIIITNQSGIGRGYYREKDFDVINNWMLQKFNEEDITILDVFYCAHTQEDNCNCRKPKIGMFKKADNKHLIDKPNSWMIGDKESDIEAAHNFGITNTIQIKNAHYTEEENIKAKAKFTLTSIKDINNCIK